MKTTIKNSISLLLVFIMLVSSFAVITASADELEVLEEAPVPVGSYVKLHNEAVDLASGGPFADWLYTTVLQVSDYADESTAVLTLCENEVARVDSKMLIATEKAVYSDITLGDQVKINKDTRYDYNGRRILLTDKLLKYTVTAIDGNCVEISNSSINIFGFNCTIVKKVNIVDLIFQFQGDLPNEEEVLDDITLGSVVTIKKGANDYDGKKLTKICYYMTFQVVNVDGDKITLNKDLSAIGLKYTVVKNVNIKDLRLVAKGGITIEEGSLVNIKNGAKDYYGDNLGVMYSYMLFRVVSINGDSAVIASDISFSSLTYSITKTVKLSDLVLATGDVSLDPAIQYILDEFGVDKTVLYGDVTSSGDVGMYDVVMLQQILAHISDFFDENGKICADVNGDGKIDMKDVVLIEQFIAGIISAYPIEVMEMFQ